jgi:ABC-type polysaccharide/polyol phosphate export permease
MNVVLMPMWVLSGAAFPIPSSHIILRTLAMINPMTYGLALVSRTLGASTSVSMTTALLVTVVFTALASLAAARLIRSR